MVRVLFVCLGNICRSPAAEGVFTKLVDQAGLKDSIAIDSCGTSGHHEGEHPDNRMVEHARRRDYPLTTVARGFRTEDFENFDYIITMDEKNYANIKALDKQNHYDGKIHKMVSLCKEIEVPEVPDPYYGGPDGFEHVLDILEDGCGQLLTQIQQGLDNSDR